MTPKFSIVVPVYNSAAYLRRCFDSICAQSLRDFEVVVVEDGSTDDSAAICDEYAARDSRFTVYHTENHGVAIARQFGLQHLTGRYMVSIDSDDLVEAEMLSTVNDVIERSKADIVVIGYDVAYEEKIVTDSLADMPEDAMLIKRNFYEQNCNRMIWNKIINVDYLRRLNIRFDESLPIYEDFMFLIDLFRPDMKVAKCSDILYHYSQKAVSLTSENAVWGAIQYPFMQALLRHEQDEYSYLLIVRTMLNLLSFGEVSAKQIHGLMQTPAVRDALKRKHLDLFRTLLLKLSCYRPTFNMARFTYNHLRNLKRVCRE